MSLNYFSKQLIVVLLMLFVDPLYAQSGQQVVIHVEEERSLMSYIASNKKNQISDLKVTGFLDSEDIKYLCSMAGRKRNLINDTGILETLDISEAVLGSYLDFSNCEKLVSIKIPETVTHAYFYGCINLKHVNAENLIFDGGSLFDDCASLEEITLMKTTLVKEGFSGCTGLKYIHLENVSEYIQTFDDCTSLETISIGKNTTCSGEGLGQAFISEKLVNIKEFIVSPENPRFCAKDGVLYSKDLATLYRCPTAKAGDFYLPDEIKIISFFAFRNCNKLSSFRAGKSLEQILSGAFDKCKSLKYVNLGNKLNRIDPSFSNCESLKEVHIDVSTPITTGELIDRDNEAVLFVPKGSYDAYWLARGWGDFKTIVEEGDDVPITSIILNKDKLTLIENESEVLTTTISPDIATDKTIVWKSADETIASVDENGKVTALKVGETTVMATSSDGKVSASCMVTVKAIEVSKITLDKSEIALEEGETFQLKATVLPENATQKEILWSSENQSVATVSAAGLVTAVKKGTVYIVAKSIDGKRSAKCKVTVKSQTVALEDIILNKETLSLSVGTSETLTISFIPKNVTNNQVKWESKDIKNSNSYSVWKGDSGR